MTDVKCPRCGGSNPPNAAFCGTCGTPLPAQQPSVPPESSSPPPWQPPAASQPPPPNPFPPPPAAFPPPPGAYAPPPPGGYGPPPGGYPGATVWGNNTKWAIGLGIVALFCCGPLAGVPGIFLAKKDMDDIAAGRAPNLDASWAKNAFYLNIVAVVLSVLGMCLWWGMGGLRRF